MSKDRKVRREREREIIEKSERKLGSACPTPYFSFRGVTVINK